MDQLTQTIANKPQNSDEQININFNMSDDILVGNPKRWEGDDPSATAAVSVLQQIKIESDEAQAVRHGRKNRFSGRHRKNLNVAVASEVVLGDAEEVELAAMAAAETERDDAQEMIATEPRFKRTRRQKLFGALGLSGAMGVATFSMAACHTEDPVTCALSSAAESCWDLNTGIRRNDSSGIERWTTAQVLSGQAGLPRVVGTVTLNAGDTYENKWVDGCIEVKGSNVTITNVLVRGGANCAGGPEANENSALISTGYNSGNQISNLKVNDSVLIGTNPAVDLVGIGASSYELEGSDVSGFTKAFIMDHNVTIANNYIHHLAAGAHHGEGGFMGAGPGNINIYNNWIRANHEGLNSGAIALYNNWAGSPGHNINIVKNYLDGDNNGVGFRGGAYGSKPGEFYYDILFAGNVIESNTVWPDWHTAEVEAWCDTCPDMEWGHPDIGPNVNENGVVYPEPTPVW